MSEPSHPLFVYGTLLRGRGAHELLGRRRQLPCTTRGALYHLPAGYPALCPIGDGRVHGHWLDPVPPALLSLLDHYDGVHEGLYRRAEVQVEAPGATFVAWAWVMDQPQARGGVLVRSGRWRPFRVR
jgi:gamma-glutamylcyclotransferase (GGCT)/AIG2-like uncharacterized protein YtfP